jgi:6-phosphogluconolactonase
MKRILLLPVLLFSLQSTAQQNELNLIVGTYTNGGKSEGIYLYKFDPKTGDASPKGMVKGVENPSYLALSADNKYVYSVNESGKNSGASAFRYNAAKGELSFLNKQPTGADPCYILSDGKNVITANYSGGSASVFGIKSDGSLGLLKQLVQHSGSSVNKNRQGSPHVHMAFFTPDHKYVVVNDLGTDKMYIYNYHSNSDDQVLILHDSVAVPPGAGPRHIAFGKDGKYAYLVREMDAGITVFSYADGEFKKIQETKLTEDGFSGENGAADIHVSPDGKFLYASNRGSENKLSIFAIEKGGLLSKRNTLSTLGKGPRNFVIDPSGRYLLVANQQTDNIVIFERNADTGDLKDTGKRIAIGSPVCLVFSPVK